MMSPSNISTLGLYSTNRHLRFNELWHIKDGAISQPSTAHIRVPDTIISHLDSCCSFWSCLPAYLSMTTHCLCSNDSQGVTFKA